MRGAQALTAVILAAGKGKRMKRLAKRHSKAMTPIMGKPITALIIESMQKAGVRDFVVVRSREDGALEKLRGRLAEPGISVKTAIQTERLGTAHALLQARNLIDGDFILCSCDNIFPETHISDMLNDYLEHRPPAVLSLEKFTPDMLDHKAGARLDGPYVLEIKEKPGRDSADNWRAAMNFLFLFKRKLLDYLDRLEPSSRGEMEIQDAVSLLMKDSKARPRGIFSEGHLHLSNEQNLIDIHARYLEKLHNSNVHESVGKGGGVSFIGPVMVDEGAKIRDGVSLGPNVYVGKDAVIERDARVEHSVIYEGAVVKRGAHVCGQVCLPELAD